MKQKRCVYPNAEKKTHSEQNLTLSLIFLSFLSLKWTVIQDNRLRKTIAEELTKFCNESSLDVCQITRYV